MGSRNRSNRLHEIELIKMLEALSRFTNNLYLAITAPLATFRARFLQSFESRLHSRRLKLAEREFTELTDDQVAGETERILQEVVPVQSDPDWFYVVYNERSSLKAKPTALPSEESNWICCTRPGGDVWQESHSWLSTYFEQMHEADSEGWYTYRRKAHAPGFYVTRASKPVVIAGTSGREVALIGDYIAKTIVSSASDAKPAIWVIPRYRFAMLYSFVKRIRGVFISYRRAAGLEAACLVRLFLKQKRIRFSFDTDTAQPGEFPYRMFGNILSFDKAAIILAPGCFSAGAAKSLSEDTFAREVRHIVTCKPGDSIVPVICSEFNWSDETIHPDLEHVVETLKNIQAAVVTDETPDASLTSLTKLLGVRPRRRWGFLMIAAFLTFATIWLFLWAWISQPPAKVLAVYKAITQERRHWRDPATFQKPRVGPYKLATGDEVDIYVEHVFAWTRFVVSEDGRVALPIVGYVDVAGLSEIEVREQVLSEYRMANILRQHEGWVDARIGKVREYDVAVVRGDLPNRSEILKLPAYNNYLMHALTSTGWPPDDDASDTAIVLRGTFKDAVNFYRRHGRPATLTASDSDISSSGVYRISLEQFGDDKPGEFGEWPEDLATMELTSDDIVFVPKRNEIRDPGEKVLVDLRMLRRTRHEAYRVDTGDILAIYIEDVMGNSAGGEFDETLDDVARFAKAEVDSNGRVALPLVDPIPVSGLTCAEIEQVIEKSYTVDNHILRQDGAGISVRVHTERAISVTVIRTGSESGSRQHKQVILTGYENALLDALLKTGGLPSATDTVTIYRPDDTGVVEKTEIPVWHDNVTAPTFPESDITLSDGNTIVVK